MTLLAALALAAPALAQPQPGEDCDRDCALAYWALLLTEPTEAEAKPPPPARKPLTAQGDCGLNCARGYLNAVEGLRRTDPKGTQIYDRLTFKKQPTKPPQPALRPTSGGIQALKLKPKAAPAKGRFARLKAKPKLKLRPTLTPNPPAKPLVFKLPPKRKKLTFKEMLRRAPKKPVRLKLPKRSVSAPFVPPAKHKPKPTGDKGGPKDRTACNQGNAEACNRVARTYWDRLKGPKHDKQQEQILRHAKDWYAKACDAGKETACWEAIGLLQRIDDVRPMRIPF